MLPGGYCFVDLAELIAGLAEKQKDLGIFGIGLGCFFGQIVGIGEITGLISGFGVLIGLLGIGLGINEGNGRQ